MAEALDPGTFTGAHPSIGQFLDQMLAWGFTRRPDKGVHAVVRGPHGGTIRVLRSLAGRADADQVAKAARLAGVTIEQFWAGPPQVASRDDDTAVPDTPPPAATSTPEPAAAAAAAPVRRPGRGRAGRDCVTAAVLNIHARYGRPLSFDEVVQLSGRRLTRKQVASASSTLCRAGALDRVHHGVYQYSGPTRPAVSAVPMPAPATARPAPAPAPPAPPVPVPAPDGHRQSEEGPVDTELLQRLLPDGVSPDMYADFVRLAVLADKLRHRAAKAS